MCSASVYQKVWRRGVLQVQIAPPPPHFQSYPRKWPNPREYPKRHTLPPAKGIYTVTGPSFPNKPQLMDICEKNKTVCSRGQTRPLQRSLETAEPGETILSIASEWYRTQTVTPPPLFPSPIAFPRPKDNDKATCLLSEVETPKGP
jgi:hypothetical protein